MSAGSNRFGHLFQWSTFGESHGPAMGVVIDGCPAGVRFDHSLLQQQLQERRPGQSTTVSARQEADDYEVLSGVYEDFTLGTPIALLVRNRDARSQDYAVIKDQSRHGHADDLWLAKFGHRDHRGGGRASARETVNWVLAGTVAQMFCLSQESQQSVQVNLESVGDLEVSDLHHPDLRALLEEAKQAGESYGAVVSVTLKNVPRALGEPVFLKFKSEITRAFMGLNAVCGVELGGGFALSRKKGTEVHKAAQSPNYGGVRGGMTTGEDIFIRVAFKPTASLGVLAQEGRHDPCVALRAFPILKALSWSILADQWLMRRLNTL